MNVDELMNEHFEIKKKMEELKIKDDNIRKEIRMFMESNEEEVYSTDAGVITYKTSKRESLDKSKVKELLSEEEFNKCIKTSEFEVLKILSPKSLDKMKAHLS